MGGFRGWGRELALSPRGLAFSLCQVSFGFMALSSVLCSPDLFAMLTCLLLGERERVEQSLPFFDFPLRLSFPLLSVEALSLHCCWYHERSISELQHLVSVPSEGVVLVVYRLPFYGSFASYTGVVTLQLCASRCVTE